MSFTRAFTSFQVSRNNYWDFISNQTREVSGKLTGVSRTFVSRTISRGKKCFREKKKKKDSFAKFSYEKQYFWKNRLLAFEGKNGRYTSTRSIYIYIYKFGKRGRHKLCPTIVVVFQPTFPLPLFHTTFVTFSFDRFVIHVDRRH